MPKHFPVPGEKHDTSTVFLITQEKPHRILLVHHKKLDRWLPPGGHQELMENAYQAVVREAKEETGIDITNYMPSPQHMDSRSISLPVPRFILEEKIDAHKDQPEHYHLDMIFVVYIPYQSVAVQKSESHAIGWFTKEDLVSLKMFDNVADMAKTLLQEAKARSNLLL